MAEFPYLKTKRLILRKLTYADSPALFEYFSQDIVTEYYDLSTLQSLVEAENLIRAWNLSYTTQRAIRWAIVLKNTNKVIGTCGLHNIHKKHYRAEIGYDLHPKFWQQGYMTETIIAIQKYGFKKLKLHRIEALVFSSNIGSKKLLHKVGFQSESVLRDYFLAKGCWVDGEMFSVLKNEW